MEGLFAATPPLEGAQTVVEWLKVAVDAIEKGNLCKIKLEILDARPPEGKALDVYTFRISYPGNEPTAELRGGGDSSRRSKKSGRGSGKTPLGADDAPPIVIGDPSVFDVKAQAKGMMKNIVSLVATLEPLPAKRFISMKLYYYDAALQASGAAVKAKD